MLDQMVCDEAVENLKVRADDDGRKDEIEGREGKPHPIDLAQHFPCKVQG